MPSHLPTPLSRRTFCRTGLFAAGAILWQPLSASILRAGTAGAATAALDPALARFVLGYASAYFLQGGSVLGIAADVHLVAQLGSVDALISAWKRQGTATKVYANGNFLSFIDAGGRFVSVENLLPADYAARRQELAAGANIRFAHEALTYAPASASLGDPFGAMARTAARQLRVLPRAAAADPVGTVLHGLVEAARFGLKADANFAALRDQTLATPATTPQEAARTAAAFVMALPALAAAGAGNAIAGLLATPRVASSLSAAYGITPQSAVRNYQLLRANADASFADSAVWLAALLGKGFQQGTVSLAAADADPFTVAQARVALADAREIASQVTFL